MDARQDTDPRMTRYFMTIPEAAALVIQSAALVDDGASRAEVFLLDMGEPIRILDLAQRFIQLHGLEPVLPDDPSYRAGPGRLAIVYAGISPPLRQCFQTIVHSGTPLARAVRTKSWLSISSMPPRVSRAK